MTKAPEVGAFGAGQNTSRHIGFQHSQSIQPLPKPIRPRHVVVLVIQRHHDPLRAAADLVARHEADDAAVGAVVAVVAHGEVVACGHGDRAEVGVGGEVGAQAYAVGDAEQVFVREDGVLRLFNAVVLRGDAVDDEAVVEELHAVAGNADDTLDEAGVGGGGIEDDDVAALGIGEARDAVVGQRDVEIVGELVDEDTVAFDDARQHGTGRHGVPVGEGTAEHDHQDNEHEEAAIAADEAGQVLRVHGGISGSGARVRQGRTGLDGAAAPKFRGCAGLIL